MSKKVVDNSKYNNAKIWQLLFFGNNDTATNIYFMAISFYFMIYCTSVYGMSAGAVGLIMMGTRIFDAITDPIIGTMVDKTNTRIGRFRPYLIVGGIILAISFYLMFAGIDFGSLTANYIWITFIYCIFIIGYTMQCTVTKSAQTVLTDNPKQRTTLTITNTTTTMVAAIVLQVIFVGFMEARGGVGTASAWQALALVLIVAHAVVTTLVIIGIAEKDQEKYYNISSTETVEKPKVKDYVRIFKRNKALQMLVVAASTNKFAYNAVNSLTVLFYFYVVGDVTMQGKVAGVTLITTFVGIAIAAIMTGKMGRRREMLYTSMATFVWSFLAILILHVSDKSFVVLVLVMGINGILSTCTNMNIIPMIADSADYELYNGGKFVPGMIGTAFSLIDKLISSIATATTGFMLTILGFESIDKTPASTGLYWGILICFFAIPALGHLASVWAMRKYPITDEVYEEVVKFKQGLIERPDFE